MSSNQEITLSELLVKVVNLVKLLWRNKILIIFCGLTLGVLGAMTRGKSIYTAQTSLLLKSEGSGSGGGLMGLAAQFGLGSDELISFEKFLGVAKSRNIIQKALLTEVKVNDKQDLIAHHFLIDSKKREAWQEAKPKYAKADLREQGFIQDTSLSDLLRSVKDMIAVTEGKGGMTLVEVKCSNEEIAYHFCKAIVDETINFFVKTSISSDLQTKKIIETRIDSLRDELNDYEQRYTTLKDQSIQTVKSKGLIDLMRMERKLRILNEMYVEATKQQEIVNFKVLNNSPGIEVVDAPKFPLPFERQSLIVRTVLFGFIGGFLGIALVLAQVAYKRVKELF